MKEFSPIEELVNELRLSLQRITRIAEEIHAEEPISIGMRGVLEFLLRHSSATVPTIARSRHVSRQLIQSHVNALSEEGLIRFEDNPAHRRSQMVTLTPRGEAMIERMRRREGAIFAEVAASVSDRRIGEATRTLRSIRSALKGGE